MTAADIWATAIGGAGFVVALLSLILAGAAQSKANKAIEAASKAGERAADALEQANELTLKLNTPAPPPWTLEPIPGGNQWKLINRTGHVVSGVFIESPDDDFYEAAVGWDSVTPNAEIDVQAVKPFVDATVVVCWMMPGGTRLERFPITVHSPHAP